MDWNDISVDDYLKIRKIFEETEDIYQRQVELVAVVSRKSVDEVLDMPIQDFRKYAHSLSFIENEPEKVAPPSVIELRGRKYDVRYDVENMTTAQYIDFQAYAVEDDYVGMTSVVLIPKGKKYNDGYDLVEVMDDIRSMKIQDLLSICFFFRCRYEALMNSSVKLLERKLKKVMKRTKDRKVKMQIGRQIVKIRDLKYTPI